MKEKSIKDAIHGYIKIAEPFWRIVDTAEFQRLKWIEQTSYRVLYPSARHDRFIHSIGVYHLGQKAIEGFLKNSSPENKELILKYKNSFLLACLLHDIGHAPFSHTCEDLYSYKEKISKINSKINQEFLSLLREKLEPQTYSVFEDEYRVILSSKGKPPAEHEVMSAIVTCKKYDEFSVFFEHCGESDIDLDLVVRSIIGCCYLSKREDGSVINNEKGIKNCLIRLLNSSTVDVDKLDYIARDTQMSGYDNIVLDAERLLDSVCVVCNDNIFYPSFKKSALSVINNVVLAKNSQAKWIVNHPIVIYEAYILKRAIGETLSHLQIKIDDTNLTGDELINFVFSSQSISQEGNAHENGCFTLMSDIEILNLMKKNISNPTVLEFFARNKRKGPIWKSQEEFRFCLGADDEKEAELSSFIAPLINYLSNVEDLTHAKQLDDNLYEEILSDDELEGKEAIIEILDVIKGYRLENGENPGFDYVVLPAKTNFFTKLDSTKVYIRFNETETGFSTYSKIENKQIDIPKQDYKFFYFYSNRKLDAQHFLNYLYEKAHSCVTVAI